jgi:hypothetical protein
VPSKSIDFSAIRPAAPNGSTLVGSLDFIVILFFVLCPNSQKNGLTELPPDCGTVLAIIEQWIANGLITRTFANTLLDEGVWALYKMSLP